MAKNSVIPEQRVNSFQESKIIDDYFSDPSKAQEPQINQNIAPQIDPSIKTPPINIPPRKTRQDDGVVTNQLLQKYDPLIHATRKNNNSR